MSHSFGLTFKEFLADIGGTVRSPAQRFALIYERGALWGSLSLMIVPAYFGFAFGEAIYFDRDPLPGYSFIVPALLSVLSIIGVKLYPLHLIARLMEGRGRYSQGRGSFRGLMSVVGYTSVPEILAGLLFVLLFLMIPAQMGSIFRNFRVVAFSILIACGAALFIWSLILGVLALRRVYQMRDLRIVLAIFLASVVSGGAVLGLLLPILKEVHVESPYLEPIMSARVMHFFNPADPDLEKAKIKIHADRLVYRFRTPKRFEIVALYSESGDSRDGKVTVGRIVGVPGDTVDLVEGKLRINGRYWEEPYVPSEFRSKVSLPSQFVKEREYLILPDNRLLLKASAHPWVAEREQIIGRLAWRKYPVNWLLLRPTVFLQAHPASEVAK